MRLASRASDLAVLRAALIARHDRHAGLRRDRLRLGFAAHAAHGIRARPDELDARSPARPRRNRHSRRGSRSPDGCRRRPWLLGRGDDLVDAQVALAGAARPDLHHLVGEPGERRAPVGLGGDGDRPHPEPARGANDPDGNLAAIGDQDFLQHGRPLPLPIVLHDGERVGVRGSHERQPRRKVLPLTLTLSPQAGRGNLGVMAP